MTFLFSPIRGSSQEIALCSPCNHTLYHGTRGSGKTATQLMKFRRYVGLGYGKFWTGIIFDFEHKNLSDMIKQSKKFFTQKDNYATFYSSPASYKWVWDTGEELHFRHAKKVTDYENFHGHEYPFIGFNELTKHPTSDLYDKMTSTNRSSFVPEIHTPKDKDGNYKTHNKEPLPPIPLIVFSTTNPSGAGHNWVKKRFINPIKTGRILKKKIKVFDASKKKEVLVVKTQVAIFGSYKEDPYLPADYIASLDELTKHNKALRKAWLEGNWDFVTGGALDDVFDRDVHILPRFSIPEGWYLDRTMDWGSTHPFSIGWFAESNGEEFYDDYGVKRFFPKGTIIQIDEWYGSKEIGTNKGLRMSAQDIAIGVKDKEEKLKEYEFVKSKIYAGACDNQIRDIREIDVDSIERKMSDNGVEWIKSDKSKGSRSIGLQLIRDRLECSLRREGQGLYFMDNCVASIETIPVLPRDDIRVDDVDTDAEDHAYDMLRYRVLSGSMRVANNLKMGYFF